MFMRGSNFHAVLEFHKAFGLPISGTPTLLNGSRQSLRLELIEEELGEYKQAVSNRDIVEIADALGDLLYVVYGAAAEHGLPIDHIVDEIHRSNMTKLDEDGNPIYRSDGKVLKGPNFELPKLKKLLEDQYVNET